MSIPHRSKKINIIRFLAFGLLLALVLGSVGLASWFYYKENSDHVGQDLVFKLDTAPFGVDDDAPVLASKTGKTYRLPWCGGSKKTKPENILEFKNAKEAEKQGFLPSKNCH